MILAHVSRWGDPKPTSAEKLERHVDQTDCFVHVKQTADKEGNIRTDLVRIELRGTLAEIPNMKNSKLPGKNFMNPDYRAKIRAMDRVFERAIRECDGPYPNFGNEQVHMILVCGARGCSFDLVGCVETIQDWLEPSTKKVGRKGFERGWGIGIIENDRTVTPEVFHSWQTGFEHQHSYLILQRWADVREEKINFIASSSI